MSPTIHFYELEKNYFDRWKLCQDIENYPQHHDDEPKSTSYLYKKPQKINKHRNKMY